MELRKLVSQNYISRWFLMSSLLLFCRLPYAVSSQMHPEHRLLKALFTNYTRSVRPVVNDSHSVRVAMGLIVSQIIDVNERDQVMTTSLWVKQHWVDYRLTWDPQDYADLERVHVPINFLWKPDILLYNNVEGTYDVSMLTKALLYSNGSVFWSPPAVYKSSCDIDVEHFPFDEQNCSLKFGSWTHDSSRLDLYPFQEKLGLYYWNNAEWEIVEMPIRRHKIQYPCCDYQYVDITFYFVLHRKSLFYIVTFVVPCVLITILTIFVFYLPSNCGEKVTLCISILLALIVFLLLIADMIPPTSKAVPLIGVYLLFSMGMVTVSILLTVIVIHVFHRTPLTHTLRPWVRTVFIEILPPYILMKRPADCEKDFPVYCEPQIRIDPPKNGNFIPNGMDSPAGERTCFNRRSLLLSRSPSHYKRLQKSDSSHDGNQSNMLSVERDHDSEEEMMDTNMDHLHHHHQRQRPTQERQGMNPRLREGLELMNFIVERTKNDDSEKQTEAEFQFVSMVLDRIFLIIYVVSVVLGSLSILLSSPVIWEPSDKHKAPPRFNTSEVDIRKVNQTYS